MQNDRIFRYFILFDNKLRSVLECCYYRDLIIYYFFYFYDYSSGQYVFDIDMFRD